MVSVAKDSAVTEGVASVTGSSVLLVVSIVILLSSFVIAVDIKVLSSVGKSDVPSAKGVDFTSVVCSVIIVIVDSSSVLVSVPKDPSVTEGVMVSSVLVVVFMVGLLSSSVTAVDIKVLSSV